MRGAFLRPFSRVGGRRCMRSGGYVFLQSPYPQHFFHAQNPPFAKKIRATERIGYQGVTIFAQPPPPPAGRARAAAERARRRATRSQATVSAKPVGVARPYPCLPSVVSARRLSVADAPAYSANTASLCPPPVRPTVHRTSPSTRRIVPACPSSVHVRSPSEPLCPECPCVRPTVQNPPFAKYANVFGT